MANQQLNQHRQLSERASGQLINRRTLFDKSREGLSLKKQIPLSKVKEYLKGAGKNATNADFAVGESERMYESLQTINEDKQMFRDAVAAAQAARDSLSDADFAEKRNKLSPNIKVERFSRNQGEKEKSTFNNPLSGDESNEMDSLNQLKKVAESIS